MSLKDAKIRYLSQELDEQEKKIHMMKDDATAPGNPGAGSTEERIVFLEKKSKEIEALVKGLTEELLDLKAITMRLSRSAESRADIRRVQPAAQPGAPAAAPSPGSTVVMQKRGRGEAPAAPAAQASPAPDEGMDLIMQTDGTMKMEKRRGDRQYIIATGNFRKGGAKSDTRRPKQDVIVAEDDDKADSKKK
jgi:hypothetical protein